MFEITVETEFAAAHAILISGAREPVHGHNWHVTVTIAGEKLDSDGLLCDFHTVEDVLDAIVAPFHNANMNDTPPFDRINPTAEHIARFIAESLSQELDSALSPHAAIASVCVTEAPRCAATYRVPNRP